MTDYSDPLAVAARLRAKNETEGAATITVLIEHCEAMERLYVATHEQSMRGIQLREDIKFLWDYRINKGFPFMAARSDVVIMRDLLDGGRRLKDIPGFAWVAEAQDEPRG